ncbi:hypothetical protein BE221DRAFT_202263 [Ostreococcus tauri]|uniref:Glycosyl transferase family 25 domain-containing protein n=1 Tax=Ostreococcus tauri TaxID=70448 RepID=A0A1Y5I398_OSTTA|nr:hypothetical protein BE221DRAFT_202263 [Ostreococcus tauri]
MSRYPTILPTLADVLQRSVPQLEHTKFLHKIRNMDDLYEPTNVSRPLAIYWINLQSSADRHHLIKSHLDALAAKFEIRSERIVAVTEQEAVQNSDVFSGWFRFTKHVSYENHTQNIYSFKELACLQSHLRALERAFVNGDDIAIIMEDDLLLREDFMHNFNRYVQHAPSDWNILQLYTLNEEVIRYFRKLRQTYYIKWFPEHWSTGAYIINRQGLSKVLRAAREMLKPSQRSGMDRVLVADEFLFIHAETYTSTFEAVRGCEMGSSIQHSHISSVDVSAAYRTKLDCHMKINDAVPRSILIVSTVRVNVVSELKTIVARITANTMWLQKSVFRVESRLYVVVDSSSKLQMLARRFADTRRADLVKLVFKVHAGRYNKFWFIRNEVPFMRLFEKVLIVDSDISLVGFPERDFFDLTSGAVISAPLRRSKRDGLLTNHRLTPRQWFAAFSGGGWEYKIDDNAFEVPFIEMFCVFMDTSFAHWYFSIILDEKYFHPSYGLSETRLSSDFGPDIMWCGAAQEWIKRVTETYRVPCMLTSLVVEHLDERQIEGQSVDAVNDKGSISRMEQAPLKAYGDNFPEWFDFSKAFRKRIGGLRRFDSAFLNYMKQYRHVSITRCLD